MNVKLSCTPAGVWKPAMLDQWKLPVLNSGSITRTVSGTMDKMPSTVAKPAPSRTPK